MLSTPRKMQARYGAESPRRPVKDVPFEAVISLADDISQEMLLQSRSRSRSRSLSDTAFLSDQEDIVDYVWSKVLSWMTTKMAMCQNFEVPGVGVVKCDKKIGPWFMPFSEFLKKHKLESVIKSPEGFIKRHYGSPEFKKCNVANVEGVCIDLEKIARTIPLYADETLAGAQARVKCIVDSVANAIGRKASENENTGIIRVHIGAMLLISADGHVRMQFQDDEHIEDADSLIAAMIPSPPARSSLKETSMRRGVGRVAKGGPANVANWDQERAWRVIDEVAFEADDCFHINENEIIDAEPDTTVRSAMQELSSRLSRIEKTKQPLLNAHSRTFLSTMNRFSDDCLLGDIIATLYSPDSVAIVLDAERRILRVRPTVLDTRVYEGEDSQKNSFAPMHDDDTGYREKDTLATLSMIQLSCGNKFPCTDTVTSFTSYPRCNLAHRL